MKKLMILIAAVAVAGVASAATFDWRSSMSNNLYKPGTTENFSGTAYLIDAAALTQSAAFTALSGGTAASALTSLASKSVSSGKISTGTTFDWGSAGDTLTAYIVVQDGDNFFISSTASAMGDASATQTLQFPLKSASQAALNTSGSYSGAGWYSSVPEPTSGLLMLVGLGALALRRRRA